MSAQIFSIAPRKPMSIIVVMTGKLDRDGDLCERTVLKFERAMAAADKFRRQNPPQPYGYVFPDCTRCNDGGQRVCDVLRLAALAYDLQCRAVEVPPPDAEFVSDADRLSFLNVVKNQVVGDCIMFV